MAAGTFATKDVAQNIAVSVSGLTLGGAQAGDYTLTQPTITANITPAPLTVVGITAADTVYDGSTSVTLEGLAAASLLGVFSGDTVDLTTTGAIGAFADRDAGTNKTVSVSGLAIDNLDYSLTQLTTTANITAQPITVAAVPADKIYDGTTGAAVLPTITSGSLVNGDIAAFSETFDSKNVGISKTLMPAGSVNDGNGGNDYAVTFVTTTIGAIGPRAITVTAAANSKVYDGTNSATATPTVTSGSVAAGDTAAFSETYNTPDVGTGEMLTPSGTVNDGNGGADYHVTFVSNASGVITQKVDHFLVNASPANVTAGNNFILTVTAEDASGLVVAGYAGTVEFNSSDPLEPHPAGNLTFTPGTGLAASHGHLGNGRLLDHYRHGHVELVDPWHDASHGRRSARVEVVFGQQPVNASAGATISSASSQAVTVDVEDPYGNLVSSSTANMTLAIASGPRRSCWVRRP